MTTSSHRPSTCSGFTLVELVATLVLLGVLSVVALPRLLSDPEFTERAFAEEVASSLRYAQRIATASGCEVNFVIDGARYTANQRPTLQDCIDETGGWVTPVLRSDSEPLSGIAPAGISISPNVGIVFRADGSVENPVPTIAVGSFSLSVDQHSGMASLNP